MSFTSADFLLFLAIAAALFRLVPASWRAAYILLVSYVFYYATSPAGAIALAAATAFAFFAALYYERRSGLTAAKAVVFGSVALLTAYLIFFKAIVLLPRGGITSWLMPLGISYYSFKLISYVLDVYWGKMLAEKRIVPFAAYVAFFPQIVAGPIQRSETFLEQISGPGSFVSAVPRIGWGLAKKLIVADHLAAAVNFVFGHAAAAHGLSWIGFYLWPLQLYADFSGLTDIAIGTGRLFGIEGPENFNRPFTATTISDYWRRWHMSLTNWLGDYVFTPLRMATRTAGNVGLVFSLSVNMIAIGLWHGFAWGYFVFGVVHSVFLSADALTARKRKSWFKKNPQWNGWGDWLGWLLTFHMVALALVYFRARTLTDANWIIAHAWAGLAYLTANLAQFEPSVRHSLFIGLVGYLVLELCERFRPDEWLRSTATTGPRFWRWSVYASCVLILGFGLVLLLASSAGPKAPFVYAIF